MTRQPRCKTFCVCRLLGCIYIYIYKKCMKKTKSTDFEFENDNLEYNYNFNSYSAIINSESLKKSLYDEKRYLRGSFNRIIIGYENSVRF